MTFSGPLEIGIDVGGTFTDAAVRHHNKIMVTKVPTHSRDHGVGCIEALRALLAQVGAEPSWIDRIAHGTTVGTNALLEGTTARCAFITTEGFGDMLELRRQNRADMYRLDVHHSPALVRRDHVIELAERCDPDGVVIALTASECQRVVEAVGELNVDAIAVCLLFSFRHPDHEHMIGDALRAAYPNMSISISSEVLAEFREYERATTTVVDAALGPVVSAYLGGLTTRTDAIGAPRPLIMQSNGGLLEINDAATHPVKTVLSGPAAGVQGACAWARAEGIAHMLTFDMGGTSCDVGVIVDGTPLFRSDTMVGGHSIRMPMLDIATVSAGGGSIAWVDSGGALRVGPHSAGATPGPAAYGNGGLQPTVTDAHVVLGHFVEIGTHDHLVQLDREAAIAAVGALGMTVGMTPEDCAQGILRLVDVEMARALRVMSTERGIHPGDVTLCAYGGAGPLHACSVADVVGITQVLVPACAGALAAIGAVMAEMRRDWVRTILCPLADHLTLTQVMTEMTRSAKDHDPRAAIQVTLDCRFQGQTHTRAIAWPRGAGAGDIDPLFRTEHRLRLGIDDASTPIEVVSIRVAAVRENGVTPARSQPCGPVAFGEMAIMLDGATMWIPAGWRWQQRDDGSYYAWRELAAP
jgi:N-methylhydantoinase A/oxoprolinase/acetone carboxylase beta subunit